MKFEVNTNLNIKTLKKTIIGWGLILTVVITIFTVLLVKESDYKKVNATIVSIGKHRAGGHNSNTQIATAYDYTYKDIKYEDILYSNTKIGKIVGKNLVMYCDPDKPGQLKNDADAWVYMFFIAFSLGMELIMFKIYRLKNEDIKREKKRTDENDK